MLAMSEKLFMTMLPTRVQQWLRMERRRLPHRLDPFRRNFGLGYGQCIDRYYIERFLAEHTTDIHGHVLELQNDNYTRRFGGERVRKSDVLDIRPGYPGATITANLAKADGIRSNSFDCIILTQTLPFIYETRAVIGEIHRLLKPGGVVLSTFPGIAQISRYGMEQWGDYWRFTTLSARVLFSERFTPDRVEVCAHGNVLVAMALLHGLVVEELLPGQLDYVDPDYEVSITVRAGKAAE
jgi:SAM-dependent methyltransferase